MKKNCMSRNTCRELPVTRSMYVGFMNIHLKKQNCITYSQKNMTSRYVDINNKSTNMCRTPSSWVTSLTCKPDGQPAHYMYIYISAQSRSFHSIVCFQSITGPQTY